VSLVGAPFFSLDYIIKNAIGIMSELILTNIAKILICPPCTIKENN
jgi:hypothetical protein